MSEREIEGALSLVRQLREVFALEHGLIDPSDWDRFTAFDLLRVAEGKTTLDAIVWGRDDIDTPRAERQAEREKLEAWQTAAEGGVQR